jgi:hypothetical protein
MAFLDKTGLKRVWANILSLVDRVVPQKIEKTFEEFDFILDGGTAEDVIEEASENLEGDAQEV